MEELSRKAYEKKLKKYREAKNTVSNLKDFYSHLGSYLVVNLFLYILNRITSPDTIWFFWISLCWGLGLAMHATHSLIIPFYFNKDWEKEKIEELLGSDVTQELVDDDSGRYITKKKLRKNDDDIS